MENKYDIKELELLALKASCNTISDGEWEILNNWYQSHDDSVACIFSSEKTQADLQSEIVANIQNRIKGKQHFISLKYSSLLVWAVSTIILGFLATIYLSTKESAMPKISEHSLIAPGKQGATLTLASGEKVRLADLVNGKVIRQAGLLIRKSSDGRLVYEILDDKSGSNTINALSTGRGENYEVVLPDGSTVRLNADSKLTYNTHMHHDAARRVSLEGEAYFKVSKNKTKPFIVTTGDQEISVLGTHFNISCYDEEKTTKTTLEEGSVRVKSIGSSEEVILKPGQQAISQAHQLTTQSVDLDAELAWKSDMFIFSGQDFKTVMRAIGRWYNVDVSFDYDPVDLKFGIQVPRSVSLPKLLENLQNAGEGDFRFKVEGRRVTVSK